jgi:hypothetical protein
MSVSNLTNGCKSVTLSEKQLNQIYMGLEARIEELQELIRDNPGTAAADDWEDQLLDARTARTIIGRA